MLRTSARASRGSLPPGFVPAAMAAAAMEARRLALASPGGGLDAADETAECAFALAFAGCCAGESGARPARNPLLPLDMDAARASRCRRAAAAAAAMDPRRSFVCPAPSTLPPAAAAIAIGAGEHARDRDAAACAATPNDDRRLGGPDPDPSYGPGEGEARGDDRDDSRT